MKEKNNKYDTNICRCFDLDKYKIWQIREAVDIAVGDDGNKSKEVIDESVDGEGMEGSILNTFRFWR